MIVRSSSDLDRELARARREGALAPLWVIWGPEQLLAIEAASAIRSAARDLGATERTVIDADGRTDWSSIEGAAASLSLFGDRKIIEVRMASDKPGKSGEASLAQLPDTLAGSDGVTMIIQFPAVEWQTQKKGWWSVLSRRACMVECGLVDRARLPEWIRSRLARNGQKASAEAVEFIACQTEGNLLAAHQEVEKLAVLGAGAELSLETVRDAILNVSRHNVADLEQALLAGSAARVARTVDGLEKEGEAMPRILWVVADIVRILLAMKTGANPGRMGLPSRVQAFRNASQYLPQEMLLAAMQRLGAIDRISKGLPDAACDTNEWTELKAVLTAMARRIAARKAAR